CARHGVHGYGIDYW
nr:immunoglobulin heavy chain junction region [Macaca mulatta]MOV49290.1 immunoglobulin heavy chain junction region [Macaca mulatta]MOV50012.1 immunoglobulin heavy chain junction region [Macaca mulatta]MOV50438.1 immunoglobulin heavy chain junction region [Macaca mulatta]MOV50689.1 immunoglobulin heavy chain junction region [Macaca mulatta]